MSEIYHIYNRGVEKRSIFKNDSDKFRFVHNLFEFNDEEPAQNIYYKRANLRSEKFYEVKPRKIERKPRKFIVKILAFCLMPNHFHLLLENISEGGISKFMQKLSTGYTMYFNKKHERVGSLFQGTYKSVRVANEAHFIHIPCYIHLNPLDLTASRWRKREINDYKKAMRFLENYRWSSFLDYIGKENFPSVTQREFLSEFFDGPEQYKKDTIKWLKEVDLQEIKHLILEHS
jgi:putative transposase